MKIILNYGGNNASFGLTRAELKKFASAKNFNYASEKYLFAQTS